MAMVFQNYALYPHLSVFENMAFGLRIKRLKDDQIKDKIKQVAQILSIEDKLYNYPKELSGGQRQRVATGRAIVRDPKLFLFDEPLSNLDARLRIELRSELIKLHRQLKRTVIFVTHDQLEAMTLGQLIVLIKDGQIQQISTPRDLYQNPQNLFSAEFIGTPPMNIIQLQVSSNNNELVLRRDSFRLKVPESLCEKIEKYIGNEIYLGIRPSGIKITKKAPSTTGEAISGEVIFVETIAEDNFAHIKLNSNLELTVKMEDNFNLKPGELISAIFDPTKMYFFDSFGSRIQL